ncbi:MAG: glycosyltransferase family protein [Rhodospirillales bacterium]|nr:glycosyltransferase family protein [Rhodospirillales bacterium]
MTADNGKNNENDGADPDTGVAGDGVVPAIGRWIDVAMEHHRFSRFQQAAEGYWKVLEADPGNVSATYYLGMVMHRVGENEKAAELVSDALANGFGGAQDYCNLGIIYHELGRLDDAVERQKQAIALDGKFSPAFFELGNVYRALGQFEAAIEALQTAVAEKPDYYQAYNNLGLAFSDVGRLDDALGCFDKALSAKPDYADAYLNMGNALRELGRPDAAAVSFQKAIVLQPDFALAHNNLGNVLMDLDLFKAAAASYAKAIDINPDNPSTHKNLGIISLLLGDFETGWPEYSWRRLEDDMFFKVRGYKAPFWDGGDLGGKTIFVYPEQGLGDTIQFVRYLSMLHQRGARVAFDVPLPMVPLMWDLEGVDISLKSGDLLPPFDCHIPLLELPGLFGTTLDTIPAGVAYLHAGQNLVDAWGERLGPKTGFRIGLVWAGNAAHLNDHNRSIAPEMFLPLVETPGVEAFSLLVGRDGEAAQVFGDAVTDLAPHLRDFSETAAAISHMDLVISVDTAVAHLAGALGADVWTMLPFNPDWRWMLDRNDSPWYPSMRLFRQEKRNHWDGVLERVATELAQRMRNTG